MLYIIVPVHNRLEKTLEFVKSLENQEFKNYQLIIIDDGSEDGTSDHLAAHFPGIIVLKGNGELFWGGAINCGLEFTEKLAQVTDYIAFANNDILLNTNSISELIKFADSDPGLSLFHSLVIDKSGKCFSSGSRVASWPFFITSHPFRGLAPVGRDMKPVKIDLATARLILFKKEVLNFVPRIDTDNFIHYLGDCDFSLKSARHQIFTYIIPSSHCYIDNNSTGENAGNLSGFVQFIKSLTSIRSSNNLMLRYRFGMMHCRKIYYPFYCISVTVKVFVSNLLIRKIKN